MINCYYFQITKLSISSQNCPQQRLLIFPAQFLNNRSVINNASVQLNLNEKLQGNYKRLTVSNLPLNKTNADRPIATGARNKTFLVSICRTPHRRAHSSFSMSWSDGPRAGMRKATAMPRNGYRLLLLAVLLAARAVV